MANITDEINQIKTAIYGKEVRGALAGGLEALNNELNGLSQSKNISELKNTIGENATQISNMTNKIDSIETNTASINNEIKDIKSKELTSSSLIEQNKTSTSANNSAITKAQTKINELNTNIKSLEAQISTITSAGTGRETASADVVRLEGEIRANKATIETLTSNISTNTSTIQSIQNSVTSALGQSYTNSQKITSNTNDITNNKNTIEQNETKTNTSLKLIQDGVDTNTLGVQAINDKVAKKANIADVYNKQEVDNKIANIPSSGGSSTGQVVDLSNYYNKSQVDEKLKDETSNINANKVSIATNSSTIKSVQDSVALGLKQSQIDSQKITSNTNDITSNKTLMNKNESDIVVNKNGINTNTSGVQALNEEIIKKANTADVYNKQEVDNKIANIPSSGGSSTGGNVNLANYYDKSQVDGKLKDKADESGVLLFNKATNYDANLLVKSGITKVDVTTKNIPVKAWGIIEVLMQDESHTTGIQKFYPCNGYGEASKVLGSMWIRSVATGSIFSEWSMVYTTKFTPQSEMQLSVNEEPYSKLKQENEMLKAKLQNIKQVYNAPEQ